MPTRFSLEVPRDREAPGRARKAVRERLAGELTSVHLDDATLIISELVSNALEHGEGTIRLHLSVDSRGLRGEVVDEGTGFEADVREHGVEDVRGRGLWLVATLANRWGSTTGAAISGSSSSSPTRATGPPPLSWEKRSVPPNSADRGLSGGDAVGRAARAWWRRAAPDQRAGEHADLGLLLELD